MLAKFESINKRFINLLMLEVTEMTSVTYVGDIEKVFGNILKGWFSIWQD